MEIKTTHKTAKSSEITSNIFREIWQQEEEIDRDKEHFWVMGLDNQNSIKYIELSTLGISDQSLVSPKETFRFAILKGINRIIVCHNHNSDNFNPSISDDTTTKQLKEASKILGIDFLDHIIISYNGYYSYAENCRI